MKVDVYWNTTKKCWSIRDAKTKKVVDHTHCYMLTDVTFVVQPAGNARVREEKRKNVHAWAKGTAAKFWDKSRIRRYRAGGWPPWRLVTYNPYKNTTFVFVPQPWMQSDGQATLMRADRALFHSNGDVYVQGGE